MVLRVAQGLHLSHTLCHWVSVMPPWKHRFYRSCQHRPYELVVLMIARFYLSLVSL
jgi:hypothetical protein